VNWALHQKERLSQGEVARSFGVLGLSLKTLILGVVVMAFILLVFTEYSLVSELVFV
jgi:hypothetical protein